MVPYILSVGSGIDLFSDPAQFICLNYIVSEAYIIKMELDV